MARDAPKGRSEPRGRAEGRWPTAERLDIASFDPTDSAASYPKIFARAFEGRRKEGFDYLEAEIAGRTPSFGYSVLAQIVASTKHKVVVTTNFDNLVIDALSIYTTATPLICGHESLAGFIRHRPTRPQIVKVHRDLFYAPRNTSDELSALPPEFAKASAQLLNAHVPVVIGYGANDGSLMGVLNDLKAGDLPQGIYWCYWNGGPRPRQEVLDLVTRHNGWLVAINGFDELMIRFQDALRLEPLDEFLKKRGDERAKSYKDRRDTLGRDLADTARRSSASRSLDGGTEKPEQSAEALQALQAVISRKAKQRTANEWDSLAKLEPDRAKRVKIYEDGLLALPNDAWMYIYAALFFEGASVTRERIEQLYKQAVRLAPNNADILGHYALFVRKSKKDYDAAETLYKQALNAAPEDGIALTNYSDFLMSIRKDNDAAEVLLRRATDTAQSDSYALIAYARFLDHVRGDRDAAEAMLKRAMEQGTTDPFDLASMAIMLFTWDKRDEGLSMLDRAMRVTEPGSPDEARCRMYQYCCGPTEDRCRTLARLRALIESGIRTRYWGFSDAIQRAKTLGHPEGKWLPKLAAVLTGNAAPSTLDGWPTWREGREQPQTNDRTRSDAEPQP